MQEIFDNYVESSFDGVEPSAYKLNQFVFNYGNIFKTPKMKTLDVGIGRGEMLALMRDSGCDYLGIDISPSTVKVCQNMNLNCQHVEDSTVWLEAHAGQFDIITCLDVVEHVPRDQVVRFVKALRGALNAQGRVVIQVPNLQSPFGYLHHFNDITHVSGFVEHSLSQLLIVGGFKNFSFFGYEEFCRNNFKEKVKKVFRWGVRRGVRFIRAVNGNPNPKILDPVMFAISTK